MKTTTTPMKIFYAKRVALLLVFLIIHHANSISFEPDPGTVFSGRNRQLRKVPSPPAPRLGQAPHYKFAVPPPPPSTTTPSFPELNRPRSFGIFLSPPPVN